MGFYRQQYWRGLPCPSPGDLPHPGIEPVSLTSSCIGRQVLYRWCHLGSPGLPQRSGKAEEEVSVMRHEKDPSAVAALRKKRGLSARIQAASRSWKRQGVGFFPRTAGGMKPCLHFDASPVGSTFGGVGSFCSTSPQSLISENLDGGIVDCLL